MQYRSPFRNGLDVQRLPLNGAVVPGRRHAVDGEDALIARLHAGARWRFD